MNIRRSLLSPILARLLLAGTVALAGCGGSGGQKPVVFLDQGLSADDRQAFYFLSQGSQLLPYDWFLALDQADSQTLFRDDAHMRELGYIPQSPDPAKNPDGLPIGLTITNAPALAKLRTDPQMIQNVLSRFVDPGDLTPYLPELPDNLKRGNKVLAVVVLSAAVGGTVDRQLKQAGLEGDALQEAKIRLNGGRTTRAQLVPPPQIVATYKARPLNGIWATAPYLHNGSVPSLYQLLLPEDLRVKTFKVGSREFDPVNVGYATNNGSAFDTSLPGNRNTGHSGPEYTQAKGQDNQWHDYSDDQRWALIEYLKTLR